MPVDQKKQHASADAVSSAVKKSSSDKSLQKLLGNAGTHEVMEKGLVGKKAELEKDPQSALELAAAQGQLAPDQQHELERDLAQDPDLLAEKVDRSKLNLILQESGPSADTSLDTALGLAIAVTRSLAMRVGTSVQRDGAVCTALAMIATATIDGLSTDAGVERLISAFRATGNDELRGIADALEKEGPTRGSVEKWMYDVAAIAQPGVDASRGDGLLSPIRTAIVEADVSADQFFTSIATIARRQLQAEEEEVPPPSAPSDPVTPAA